MKHDPKFIYPKSTRSLVEGERHYDLGVAKLPSVTTILSARQPDGEAVESVLIPVGGRRTLCISSQVGCALGCVFCATGRMGFRPQLTPAEIAGQVREIILGEPAIKPTNVVFMGMGEPLLNWEAVDVALTVLNHPEGLGIGARHITLSTVGILPALARFGDRPEQFRLAVSLHAPTSAQRHALMPIEKKYRLADLVPALERFRRRVTLEYVLIAGRNDSLENCILRPKRQEIWSKGSFFS